MFGKMAMKLRPDQTNFRIGTDQDALRAGSFRPQEPWDKRKQRYGGCITDELPARQSEGHIQLSLF